MSFKPENYRSPQQMWNQEVDRSKEIFAGFMQRTGIVIDLEQQLHWMKRRRHRVLHVIGEMYPMVGRSWLSLMHREGHRPGLNRSELRAICVKLRIPRWNDMTTDEMRATLVILTWLQKIDPEASFWDSPNSEAL